VYESRDGILDCKWPCEDRFANEMRRTTAEIDFMFIALRKEPGEKWAKRAERCPVWG